MEYEIAPAKEREFEDITRLFYKTDYNAFPPPLSKRWVITSGVRKDYPDKLTDEERWKALEYRTKFLAAKGQWFVAKYDSIIVGAVITLNGTNEVEALIVDPEYRRKGIGLSLFKEGVDYLSSLNYLPIKTTTWSNNIKSQQLFKKLGFKEVERKKEKRGGVERESIIFELY